jgi:hypothetical protein
MVPAGKAYYEHTVLPMMDAYRAGDTREAVRIFRDALVGPDWQPVVGRGVPGGMSQVPRDADTRMLEQPAIREWAFGPEEAAAIRQPVLSVLGVGSHRLVQEGRALLHAWFPQTEDADVPGTHLHPLQDPRSVAHALAAFFARRIDPNAGPVPADVGQSELGAGIALRSLDVLVAQRELELAGRTLEPGPATRVRTGRTVSSWGRRPRRRPTACRRWSPTCLASASWSSRQPWRLPSARRGCWWVRPTNVSVGRSDTGAAHRRPGVRGLPATPSNAARPVGRTSRPRGRCDLVFTPCDMVGNRRP